MSSSSLLLSFITLLAPSVFSWGVDGHANVAHIAFNYLDANAQSYVSNLLGSGVTMDSVASWADSYKYGKGGAWSKPNHFVDIQDNPPSTCGFDEARDCAAGNCINIALANYTNQLCSADGSIPSQDITNALKFIIHYFGDVTQPLHNSKRDVGGNSDSVTYNGANPNFHSIWDKEMVEDRESANTDQTGYQIYLIQQIDTGIFASEKASWISKQAWNSVTDLGSLAASIDYSKDSDTYDCSYVWPQYDADPSADFSGNYYKGASPIIDIQIAKGGYRLAYHLNQAFAACAGITPTITTTTTAPPKSTTTKVKVTSTTKKGGKTTVTTTTTTTTKGKKTSTHTPAPTPASSCHDVCVTGVKLSASCGDCAAQIIAQDSYCESTSWNSYCVDEVKSICGLTC